jgi:NAD(P)-dependent dehydrogenase (short-subunit alcohol dehydrogenase family)
LRRASTVDELRDRALGVAIGDLSSAEEARAVADQVNAIGTMDAVIHNAGIYLERDRGNTPEGHAKTLAVNTLAPYILTALIERPRRLIYLTSGMHKGGGSSLDDIDWTRRRWNASEAYSESKLHVAALAAAIARHWPEVFTSSVDPGWVPTKMGGVGAPDDLEMGHQTQVWLATAEEATTSASGAYWYHRQQRQPARSVNDRAFQDDLIEKLTELTSLTLFR